MKNLRHLPWGVLFLLEMKQTFLISVYKTKMYCIARIPRNQYVSYSRGTLAYKRNK